MIKVALKGLKSSKVIVTDNDEIKAQEKGRDLGALKLKRIGNRRQSCGCLRKRKGYKGIFKKGRDSKNDTL